MYQWPFVIGDAEVEQALNIIVYYFQHRDGVLPPGTVEGALAATYGYFRKGVRHPLVLANKTITALEAESRKSKAA